MINLPRPPQRSWKHGAGGEPRHRKANMWTFNMLTGPCAHCTLKRWTSVWEDYLRYYRKCVCVCVCCMDNKPGRMWLMWAHSQLVLYSVIMVFLVAALCHSLFKSIESLWVRLKFQWNYCDMRRDCLNFTIFLIINAGITVQCVR